MSSTRGKDSQIPNGQYPTPSREVNLICGYLYNIGERPLKILEPGCGAGNFLDVIAKAWPNAEVTGVEIDSDLAYDAESKGHNVIQDDIFKVSLDEYDLILGNPPFDLALEFIEYCKRHLSSRGSLVFLLRMGFFHSQGRYEWWRKNMPSNILALPCRPKFVNGKTDSCDYGFFIWRASMKYRIDAAISHLDNRTPKASIHGKAT